MDNDRIFTQYNTDEIISYINDIKQYERAYPSMYIVDHLSLLSNNTSCIEDSEIVQSFDNINAHITVLKERNNICTV